MNEPDVRTKLIDAAIQRANVAVRNKHDGIDCIAVGRVGMVTKRHVTIVINRGTETVLPLDQIYTVTRLDGPPLADGATG